MARFWPKWRYNGRAMARETFFYQCLWVTKFCAKFGRSRIPRTARAPNSFIVLRCMWKEPAPLPGPAYFALFKTVFANGRLVVAVVFFRTLAEASCRVLFASEGPASHVNGYLVLSHHVKRLLRWHYDQLLCKHPSFSNFYWPHFSLVTSPSESELHPNF